MNWLRTPVLVAIFPLVIFAGGCSRFRSDYESSYRAIDPSAVSRLASMTDVLDILGPPTVLGRAGTGIVLMYEDVTIREAQFGINLSYDWLSIFKLVIARGEADVETLAIVVDASENVVSRSFSKERRTIGYGGSFDLIFVALPAVDTRDYTDLAPQHDWGNGLSESVPVMLNAPYSVRQGVGGVERVGTPDEVGQETLGHID